MILKESGQSFQHGAQTFLVGGIAFVPMKNGLRQLGMIQEVDVEDECCPKALCDFGGEAMRRLPMESLTPLAVESPEETGQMYALYYLCDNSDGPSAKVLGISASKSALLHLMLEDVKNTEDTMQHLDLSSAYANQESKSLWFSYDGHEPPGSVYLCYNIEPVPVYSGGKGETAV